MKKGKIGESYVCVGPKIPNADKIKPVVIRNWSRHKNCEYEYRMGNSIVCCDIEVRKGQKYCQKHKKLMKGAK